MEFKDKIKIRREELGLTLEDVAKVVGVSIPTIQRYESGEIQNVRRDKIANLAKALEVSPSYLMGWDEDSPIEKKEKSDTKMYFRVNLEDLTDEERAEAEEELEEFAEFVKQKLKNKRK